MAAPIDLRNDFDSVSLRRLAKRTRDATQSRRLLALAEVYDGGSRTDASRIGGVGLQIIRDWVLRFNARGPDGLVDGKSPGAPSKLNADHRRALAEVVEAGPVPAVDGVVRWRRKDLARWLLETFAISLDETTVGRELKALGFAKISARPRHYAQNELAVEAFKKNSARPSCGYSARRISSHADPSAGNVFPRHVEITQCCPVRWQFIWVTNRIFKSYDSAAAYLRPTMEAFAN